MIPLHRPFFGVGAVLGATLAPRPAAQDLRHFEEAHAAASGCAQAVWLPSARAGIAWALRAAIDRETRVIGPAFTCSVVHEAMGRAGGQTHIVDAAADAFALEPAALSAARNGNHALVLSEPYGHPYDLAALAAASASAPKIRIVDSAMAVPHPSLFARLCGNDFAVISFGSGKTAFAGWGAMGFTRDAALAAEVRQLRDARLSVGDSKLTLKRSLSIGLRTAAQHPLAFSATRKLWYQVNHLRSRRQKPSASLPPAAAAPAFAFPATWADDQSCGVEWRRPSTRVDRGLALRNLETAAVVHARRLQLAERYGKNLAGAPGLRLPPVSPFALSHFTVRVDARLRNRVKEELMKLGVYTISLWTFSPHLDPQEFPNAARCCAEVINLPLSPWMNAAEVDRVCEHVVRSVTSLAS